MTTQVKRFVAGSVQEAVNRVKTELGPQAVIYHTRSFHEKGPMGIKRNKKVEVLAGIESNNPRLEKEIMELKKMVNYLNEASKTQNESDETRVPQARELSSMLAGYGLKENIIQGVLSYIAAADCPELNDEKTLLYLVKEALIERLPPIKPIRPKGDQPLTVAFVGPTGVGKTTTVAKLAANFTQIEKENVGLITVDFKRMGAYEQLKQYSEILDLDLVAAVDAEQLAASIRRFGGKDLILIDTPGLNPFNGSDMNILKRLLDNDLVDEVLLVLGLNTREDDLERIMTSFKLLNYTGLIFSKLDETQAWGALINLVWGRREFLSYITVGQNVPEDIELLQPQRFLDALAFALAD